MTEAFPAIPFLENLVRAVGLTWMVDLVAGSMAGDAWREAEPLQPVQQWIPPVR